MRRGNYYGAIATRIENGYPEAPGFERRERSDCLKALLVKKVQTLYIRSVSGV
jgi:hypothetical protein